MMPTLPRMPRGDDSRGINPVDIAGAVSMLRFDTIKSVKWDIRPSVGIVAKDVDRLGMDIRSFRAPLAAIIRQVMIPSIRTNFSEEGRPDAWEPLADSTVEARGNAGPILRRTGLLARRARQFNIWDIGEVSATIRRFPSDAFYGVYHQAGAERDTGSGGSAALLKLKVGSTSARKALGSHLTAARKELGPRASQQKIHNRAIGLAADDGTWSLPARPFIMYQESDIPKMEAIFAAWMTERARHSGRFTTRG